MELHSTDANDQPLLHPNIMSDQRDLAGLIGCFKTARALTSMPAMAAYTGIEIFPGAAFQTDEELAIYILSSLQSAYHTSGTCKMVILNSLWLSN